MALEALKRYSRYWSSVSKAVASGKTPLSFFMAQRGYKAPELASGTD